MKINKVIRYSFPALIILLLITIAFGFETTIIGRLSEIYDDNINSSFENAEDDFITEMMLGLEINQEERLQTFGLIAHIYQQLYYSHRGMSYNYQDLEINYELQFLREQSFLIRNIFQNYPEPAVYGNLFEGPAAREAYYQNSLTLTLLNTIYRQYLINTHYTNTIIDYKNDELIDSNTNSAGMRIGFSWSSANITSIFYDYTYIKLSSGDESSGHRGGFEYQHYFTRQIYTVLRAGTNYIRTDDGDTVKGEFYFASFTDNIDENNTILIYFNRDITVSSYNNEIFESWRISGDFNRQITGRLIFSFIAFYGVGEYKYTNLITKLIGVTTSIRYDIKENIFCSLEYSYTRNDTILSNTDEHFAYDRNRIQFSLTAEF